MELLTPNDQETLSVDKKCRIWNKRQEAKNRIAVILWWTHWNTHHKNGEQLIYKQIPTGEVKGCGMKLVRREEYMSAQEFLDTKNILEEGERLPTRQEVLNLWEDIVWFMDDRNYLFDDQENGLWIFRKWQDSQVEIIPISQASYSYIRTIIEE